MKTTELTEKNRAGRLAMIEKLVGLCKKHGVPYKIEELFHGDPKQDAIHILAPSGLRLTIDFDGGSYQMDTHVLSWHMDYEVRDRIIAEGFCGDVNTVHFRKGTDICYGWEDLEGTMDERLFWIAGGRDTEPVENKDARRGYSLDNPVRLK